MAEPESQLEQPIYTLPQSKKRALIPSLVLLAVLSAIFYLGVLLNLSLLKLNQTQEKTAELISIIVLGIIIIFGIYFYVRQARQPYLFYRNRITFNKKSIEYAQIVNTAPKQDILDKLFGTYSIGLSKNFYLRNIPEEIQISDYLQRLIDYSKRMNYSNSNYPNS